MKYNVTHFFNENPTKEYQENADSDLDLSVKLAPGCRIFFGNELIKSLKLKETDTDVHVGENGSLFFFTPNGDKIGLEDINAKMLLEPVGAYHSKILEKLDIETIVFEKIK